MFVLWGASALCVCTSRSDCMNRQSSSKNLTVKMDWIWLTVLCKYHRVDRQMRKLFDMVKVGGVQKNYFKKWAEFVPLISNGSNTNDCKSFANKREDVVKSPCRKRCLSGPRAGAREAGKWALQLLVTSWQNEEMEKDLDCKDRVTEETQKLPCIWCCWDLFVISTYMTTNCIAAKTWSMYLLSTKHQFLHNVALCPRSSLCRQWVRVAWI